jgi:hypothetical protein
MLILHDNKFYKLLFQISVYTFTKTLCHTNIINLILCTLWYINNATHIFL